MSGPAPHTPRATRGASLLELLIVVVILGTMAGLAGVVSDRNAEVELDQAALLVQDACIRAQALARSARTPHGVVFDADNERFAIVAEDGTPARDPLTRTDAITNFGQPNQPRHIEIDSADFGDAGTAALYDAQGVPLTGGTLTLRRGEATRTLTLDPATGALLGP